MADDELVQGGARRDEHANRAGPASCAAELLPGRRDGARIAHQDCALQAADVDAQLERIRAHDACDVSAAQPRLYLASVQREVAGPVTAHAPRRGEARMRFSGRLTFATWLPNRPRYVWSSSMTTNSRLEKRRRHRVWWGSRPVCSMSGLVITTWPPSRIAVRRPGGVSPS